MEGEFQRKSSNLLKKFRTALLQPHFYLLCAKTAMRIGELMSSSWRTHGNARLVGTEKLLSYSAWKAFVVQLDFPLFIMVYATPTHVDAVVDELRRDDAM